MENKNIKKDLSLYIHIPFCERKCHYCDFLSFSFNNDNEFNQQKGLSLKKMELNGEAFIYKYFQILKEEALKYSQLCRDYVVKSIFIGGGTPSFVDENHIVDLLKCIYENYQIDEGCEISMEANPSSLTLEKAKKYLEGKVNRISIGVQSFNNGELKILGRVHDEKMAIKSIENAMEAGFTNINLDIMFDIPGQNRESLFYSIEKALSFQPKHLSIYSLEIEEGTKFYDDYKNGKLDISDNEKLKGTYKNIQDYLDNNGYNQYEVSNYSKEGYSCYHNDNYWKYGEYLGLGLGASSFYKGKRFSNKEDFHQYYLNVNQFNEDSLNSIKLLTADEEISIYTFTSLRRLEGVDLDDFYNRFNVKFQDYYEEELSTIFEEFKGFTTLDLDRKRYYINRDAMVNSNSIMCLFIKDEES